MTGYGRSSNRLAALVIPGLLLGLWAGQAAAQTVADDVVCAGCVQGSDIANGTIGPNKIIPGSINAATIANGVIGPNKLIPGSINAATIANRSIGTNKLIPGSINTSVIANGAVTGTKIADGAVGLADLSPAVQQIIADLQAQVAAMQAFLEVVVVEDVATDLNGDGDTNDIDVDLDGDGVADAASEFLPTVRFEGVNLQLVNGDPSQSTNSLNALGNLIVGYNEARTGASVCSDGAFADQAACEANGHVWAPSHKSGSHNLVVGRRNAYSRTGGVVFGETNVVNRRGASVTGGQVNTASGDFSSISGGDLNRASGPRSSVSGGRGNTASEETSSVSGGRGEHGQRVSIQRQRGSPKYGQRA